MKSKASLDTLSKVITVGVLLLFIAIGQKNIRAIVASHGDLKQISTHIGVLVLLFMIIVVSYLFSPTSYSMTAHELIIHRPVKDRVINISDIIEVRLVDPEELIGTIRTFGVGGLFGYYGSFSNAKFGTMTWYITQKANRALIRTRQGDKIIISPDDQGLIHKLENFKS